MRERGPGLDASQRDDEPGTGGEVLRLGRTARWWRTLLVSGLGVLFVLGSVVGQDDWWPFSPWRMFSTSTPPTGAVVFMALEVQDGGSSTWRSAGLTPSSVGLNRAEVEGRIPQIEADPALLGTLATSHARLHPAALPWTGVRVVRHEAVIVDRRPTGEERVRVLATWHRDGAR
ncbi:hypothetical protein GCM10028814_24970 [Angustibacter aerolatus]